MPKGLTPKKRRLRKQTKPLRQASRLVDQMIEVMNRKGKSGLPSITVHGRRKKLRQLASKGGARPISKGRGK
jgi:hypothetical protein